MMKPISFRLLRFAPMSPWTNRILRVDLSDMTARVEESAPYLPNDLGSPGLAARLCWEAYPEPIEPFDPGNPLMGVFGALTGSRVPYSDRTTSTILADLPGRYLDIEVQVGGVVSTWTTFRYAISSARRSCQGDDRGDLWRHTLGRQCVPHVL